MSTKWCFWLFLFFISNALNATQTSLYWTNANTDVVPTRLLNFDVDNYFTVFRAPSRGEFFAPDIGLEWGIFTLEDISAEVGLDYLGGFDYPWFFNGKIGMEEKKLFSNAPSFSIGFYDVGTGGRFNFNIIDIVIGKTLPQWIGGRLFFGGFLGNHQFGKNRGGFMVGYQKAFCDAVDCCGMSYQKWVFVADYASGKNAQGGGGFGLTYYFTPRINVITGPVWFSDSEINGSWKWTVQLNFYIPFIGIEYSQHSI